MPSIFPDTLAAGAVMVRNALGNPVPAPNVENAFIPPAEFTTSCVITALPTDCGSRVTPSQMNAIVSELLCLAYTWDPTGDWDCGSLCNLGTMFQAWYAGTQTDKVVNTEILFSASTVWDDGEYVFAYPVAEAMTVPQTLVGSRAFVRGEGGAPVTGSLRIFKNATQVGTIDIAGSIVTFIFLDEVALVPGDLVTFRAVGLMQFEIFSLTLLARRALTFV